MNRAATNPNSVPTANPLGTESVIKLTVRYAVPSVISLVVNSRKCGNQRHHANDLDSDGNCHDVRQRRLVVYEPSAW